MAIIYLPDQLPDQVNLPTHSIPIYLRKRWFTGSKPLHLNGENGTYMAFQYARFTRPAHY